MRGRADEARPYGEPGDCRLAQHEWRGSDPLKLLRTVTVKDLAELFPERFSNKTNGVTPRQQLLLANQPLAKVITEAIGDGWITDLGQLHQLEPLADDRRFATPSAMPNATPNRGSPNG